MVEKMKRLHFTRINSSVWRSNLQVIPLSGAKKNLNRMIDALQTTDGAVVITKHGSPAAVLMSYAAYESRSETASVLSDPAFMKEIRKGLHDLRTKKARLYTLEELFLNK